MQFNTDEHLNVATTQPDDSLLIVDAPQQAINISQQQKTQLLQRLSQMTHF
jgi:hypothetical protein